jgi:hypothetical protein
MVVTWKKSFSEGRRGSWIFQGKAKKQDGGDKHRAFFKILGQMGKWQQEYWADLSEGEVNRKSSQRSPFLNGWLRN